jgi:hypothetical protein
VGRRNGQLGPSCDLYQATAVVRVREHFEQPHRPVKRLNYATILAHSIHLSPARPGALRDRMPLASPAHSIRKE